MLDQHGRTAYRAQLDEGNIFASGDRHRPLKEASAGKRGSGH